MGRWSATETADFRRRRRSIQEQAERPVNIGDDSLPGRGSHLARRPPNPENPIKPGGAYRFLLRAGLPNVLFEGQSGKIKDDGVEPGLGRFQRLFQRMRVVCIEKDRDNLSEYDDSIFTSSFAQGHGEHGRRRSVVTVGSGLPLLLQITFSTCRAPYPGGSPRCFSVEGTRLPARASSRGGRSRLGAGGGNSGCPGEHAQRRVPLCSPSTRAPFGVAHGAQTPPARAALHCAAEKSQPEARHIEEGSLMTLRRAHLRRRN
jgi:hypothetical protein